MLATDAQQDRAQGTVVGKVINAVAVSASCEALLEEAVNSLGCPWALVLVDQDLAALPLAPGCLAGCRRLAATLGSTTMQALVVRAPNLDWAQRMAEASALPVVYVDGAACNGAAVVVDIGSIEVVNPEPGEILSGLEDALGTTLLLAEPQCAAQQHAATVEARQFRPADASDPAGQFLDAGPTVAARMEASASWRP